MPDPFAVTTAVLFANQVAAGLGTETGKGVWAGLGRLEALVRRKLSPDPGGKAVLGRIQAAPRDEAAVQVLAELVEAHLAADDAFRRDVLRLLAEATDSSAGEFVVAVMGDARVGKITQIRKIQGNVSF